MAKPIINKITPFDAATEKIITFSCDGIQPYYNELFIYNDVTMDLVYHEIASTMKLEHVIPANTLTNGVRYIAQIKCYTFNQEASTSLSDSVWFNCFTTPRFDFSNIPEDMITIDTASLSVTVVYEQIENEQLDSFAFYLYNAEGTLIRKSNTYYTYDNLTYLYRMLDNNATYKIRCIGYTQNEFEVDTGFKTVHVEYKHPETYSIIRAQVEPSTGIIDYYTDIRYVDASRSDYMYIDEKYIDLKHDVITYEQGYNLKDDYIVILRLRNELPGTVTKMYADTHMTILDCIDVDELHFRYRLTVYDILGFEYLYYTLPIEKDLVGDKIYELFIQRENSLYFINIKEVEVNE